jgi:hypothetical protein
LSLYHYVSTQHLDIKSPISKQGREQDRWRNRKFERASTSAKEQKVVEQENQSKRSRKSARDQKEVQESQSKNKWERAQASVR